jgi:heme-degrading monooxygenase HmoA
MIMTFLTFNLNPGNEEKMKEVFLKWNILETSIQVEGCYKLALVAPQERADRVHVVGFWEDNQAYQRWIDHPERGAAVEDISALLNGTFDSSAPAPIMDVLHAVPKSDAWTNAG